MRCIFPKTKSKTKMLPVQPHAEIPGPQSPSLSFLRSALDPNPCPKSPPFAVTLSDPGLSVQPGDHHDHRPISALPLKN